MSYGRLLAAAVAATIVDLGYGLLIYGQLLAPEFEKHSALYRPPDVQAGYMPEMLLGIFVGMIAAAWIYAKGHEGGRGAIEGLRFGAVMAVFVVGYTVLVNYSILNISRQLAVAMAAAGVIEWLIVGVVIGVVYSPVEQRRPQPATV